MSHKFTFMFELKLNRFAMTLFCFDFCLFSFLLPRKPRLKYLKVSTNLLVMLISMNFSSENEKKRQIITIERFKCSAKLQKYVILMNITRKRYYKFRGVITFNCILKFIWVWWINAYSVNALYVYIIFLLNVNAFRTDTVRINK